MTTSDIVSSIINLLREGSDGIGGDWGCDEAVEAVQKLVAASERRRYCPRCGCSLTSTDYEAGRCTQCGHKLARS
jgi:hypothetical protein